MQLLIVILGLIVLVYGRRLFWLSVIISGFLLGMELTNIFFTGHPYWVKMLGGLAAGLIGAVIAVFIERIAFALVGLYAGAYLAIGMAHGFGLMNKDIFLGIIGALAGAIISGLLMDWAIIVLSSLVGSGAIISQLELDHIIRILVFFVLFTIGCFTQTRGMDRPSGRVGC